MAFNISPAVNWREIDATLSVRELGDYTGAMPIKAQWGPINKAILVTNGEDEYTTRYWKPDDNTYLSALVAHDFLSYSSKAWFYRMAGPNTVNAVPVSMSSVLVRNQDELEGANLTGYDFVARYAGGLGNGLTIDICDSASFDTWEYNNNFQYKPESGEFAVAVIDGSGEFTGVGAARQVERIEFIGDVVGGVQQQEELLITGSATGGTKQVEVLTFSGLSTGTTFTVDGTPVTILVGDTPSQVATKVAAELALNTAVYESAVALANTVTVTFAEPALRVKIASNTENGVGMASSVTTYGDASFNVLVQGYIVTLEYGDPDADITGKIKAVLETKVDKFTAVTLVNPTTIGYTYVEYGLQTTPTTTTADGITYAYTATVVGDGLTSITVFGIPVAVENGDSSSAVATKVAAEFNLVGTLPFDNIYAKKNGVYYTSQLDGLQTPQATPASPQAGLVIDIDVVTPGRLGTILERFELLDETVGSTFQDGTAKYFADAINTRSSYIYVGDADMPLTRRTVVLGNGVDDYNVNLTDGFKEFLNSETYDVNYIIASAVSVQEQKAAIDVSLTRRDCLTYVSPQFSDCVDNKGNELEDVLEWRTIETNKETSYAFNDCNWALVYDSYNNVRRWIPCCGGTAGLKARTDRDVNAWQPPAGLEYGVYKNYIRLAWNPNKAQRDELYKVGVNSIVSFQAKGIVLYGDKTSLSRPSAFDRVNVRSAFIVAEKSIASFAQYFLFKINNEFTRTQFLAAVNPFLRNMQARGAFEDFEVVCDERNNNEYIRASNTMVGTIKLKPAYSINYIDLNFVAVGANLTFDEVGNLF